MPITLQFARRVLRLRRRTDIEIAVELQRRPEDVAEACRMLLLPAVGDNRRGRPKGLEALCLARGCGAAIPPVSRALTHFDASPTISGFPA